MTSTPSAPNWPDHTCCPAPGDADYGAVPPEDWDQIDETPQTPSDVDRLGDRVRKYSTAVAARIGGCHARTILKLLHDGHLAGQQVGAGGPTCPWVVDASRNQIREAVMQYAPRSGYTRKTAQARRERKAKATPPSSQPRRRPATPAGPPTSSSSPRTGLETLVEWAQIVPSKRPLLLALAKRTEAELAILLDLCDL
jgi:hypothetical protein